MLLYHNQAALRQLFQGFGSVVFKPHIFIIGCVVAAVTAWLQVMQDAGNLFNIMLPHQYPIQTLGGIATIGIVFRTNQAWTRYWEAVSYLHLMYSKWSDSFSQFSAFVSVTIMKAQQKGGEDVSDKVSLLLDLHEKVENDFLLLSAMACDRICRGDCARMERRHELGVAWPKRVVLREDLRKGEDLTNATGMPKFKVHTGRDVSVSSATSEGEESAPFQVIKEASTKGVWDAVYALKKEPSGAKYDLLANSFDRCNMVVNWLNHNLAYSADVLSTPPPIQSRMYQEISNGMLGFNNALKLADIPFSFPYTQILLMLLIVWVIFVPFYVMSFTRSLVAGPAFAFLLSSFTFAMNDVAGELENPFGHSANRICVPEFHARFLLVIEDASRSCHNPPRPPRTRNHRASSSGKGSLIMLDVATSDSSQPTELLSAESLVKEPSAENTSRVEPRSPGKDISRERISSDASLIKIEERSENSFIVLDANRNVLSSRQLVANGSAMRSGTQPLRSISDIEEKKNLRLSTASDNSFVSEALTPAATAGLRQPGPIWPMTPQTPSAPLESKDSGKVGMNEIFLRLTEVSERVEQHVSIITDCLQHITKPVGPRKVDSDVLLEISV